MLNVPLDTKQVISGMRLFRCYCVELEYLHPQSPLESHFV